MAAGRGRGGPAYSSIRRTVAGIRLDPATPSSDAFAATRLDVAGEPAAGSSTLRLTFDYLGTKSNLSN